MQRVEFRAMGSRMLAVLDAEDDLAWRALNRVPSWFEAWEDHLSRFRPESELNQLNRRAGQWVTVSPVLWHTLAAARRLERLSAGLVTPALQGALEGFGYDRSFELIRAVGPGSAAIAARQLGLPRLRMAVDPVRRAVRLAEGMLLDLGGVAKGWAADQALAQLREYGPALVDAGGDISASPPAGAAAAWPVGVTDPANPEGTIELLLLRGGGLATSGTDVHRWQQGGLWRHHIIDPCTGEPARSRVLAATALAPTAVEAEMAAKCGLILGADDGLRWLDARPAYSGLLALEDGRVLYSRGIEGHLWRE